MFSGSVIGISCMKDGYTWSALDLNGTSPRMIRHGSAKVPANSARGRELAWLYLEIVHLLQREKPRLVYLKRAELGPSMRAAVLEHSEMDGVVLAALGSADVYGEALKWATIVSRLRAKSKADVLSKVGHLELVRGVPKNRWDSIAVAMAGEHHQ